MKIIILTLFVFQIISSNVSRAGEIMSEVHTVSIAALLSAPKNFDEKVVKIVGAGKVEFESSKICLSMEDIKFNLVFNCLKLVLPLEIIESEEAVPKYDNEYVFVKGVFKMSNAAVETTRIDKKTGFKVVTKAIQIPYVGQITNVSEIRKW